MKSVVANCARAAVRRHARGLPIAGAIVALAAASYACRDVTAPSSGLHSGSATASLNGPGPVRVTADSMHGWSFIDDQRNVACTDPTGCRIVGGPGAPPLGNGSAELAASATTDGLALALGDYGGTLLSRVTTLTYATYRQSPDSARILAIALQLNVDFDLSDAVSGWQGRIVFEPYMTAGSAVADTTWQTWDALGGKWWGTKSVVTVNGVSTPNPCVQSSPCTWADLIQRFPNIGIHRTYGGIVLKAGSGWAGFRGNVDALTIGIDGAATTFNFDAPSANFHLRASVVGVESSAAWSPDTSYPSGTQVAYAFTTRPGWHDPIVVLDDTIASRTGVITMNGDHTLEVVADSIYTYEGLQPLERSIADLTRALLDAPDKFSAAQALSDFLLTELQSGRDEGELDRARIVAEHVVIDPARDAAALDATDATLAGHNFYVDVYPDGSLDSYDAAGPYWDGVTLDRAPTGVGRMPTAQGSTRASVSSVTGSLSRTGIQPRAAIRHILRGGTSTVGGRIGSGPSRDLVEVAVPDTNTDQTQIIYTNGIWNSIGAAIGAKNVLATYVRDLPEFARNYPGVVLHYNRTSSDQMRQYAEDHPCLALAEFNASFQQAVLGTATPALVEYAHCLGTTFVKTVTSADLIESATTRRQLAAGTPVTNPDVDSLVKLIRYHRERRRMHVILVGHSEGSIIDAQAVRTLASRTNIDVQQGDRCIAALAFAPATPRSSYGLDQYHLKGLLADGDLVTLATPNVSSSDWETFASPLDAQYHSSNLFTSFITRGLIHQVRTSYLTSSTRQRVVNNLLELRRECIPARAELNVSASTASPGTEFRGTFKIWNQNGRRILGRHPIYGWTGGRVTADPLTHDPDQPDYLTLRAQRPDTVAQLVVAGVMEGLQATAPVMVPMLSMPVRAYSEGRSTWDLVSVQPGTQNPTYRPAPPSEDWDGSVAQCTRLYPVAGDYGSVFYYKRVCFRNYKVDFVRPDTIPGGWQVMYAQVKWVTTNGADEPPSPTMITPPLEYACFGDQECLSSAVVELLDPYLHVVARSEPQVFSTPTVLSSRALIPLGAPGISTPVPSGRRSP